MPTGNLPASGKKLWESVYDTALKGSCKGDKGCAAGSAWKAVKNAGWVKDAKGNWHKKSVVEAFSLTITKAAYEKSENRMNFLAVGSDTDEDSYKDNMTLKLFSDFIGRIQSAEMPPEQYRSEFWKGGLPYISLSHYPDLDGKAVPGVVEAVYIDGNRLKAKGYFLDTTLGRACFKATCEDLYGKNPHKEGPIRISIAFLDYSHRHKSNGFVFTRSEDEPICIECLREYLSKSNEGKEFLLGHLIHLALTRVPVNQRTSLEVKSMAINTRKEDALSIVGEDDEAKSLVDTISKEAALVGKSELVIKSDLDANTDEIVVEEAMHDKEDEKMMDKENEEEDAAEEKKPKKEEKKSLTQKDMLMAEPVEVYRPFGGATSLSEAKAYIEAGKEKARIGDIWYAFLSVIENINQNDEITDKASAVVKVSKEFKDLVADKTAAIYNSLLLLSSSKEESHPLDELLGTLKAEYDKAIALSATADEKLRSLQEPFNVFSQTLIEKVRSSVPVEKTEIAEKSDVSVETITESVTQAVMGKVGAQLAEITAMLKSQPVTKVDPTTVTREDVNELIHRRSLVPTPSQNPQQQPPKKDALGVVKYKSITEIVNETT